MGAPRVMAVGTCTVDIVAYGLPRVASPGETVYLEEPIRVSPGGHAVNVSVGLSRLGYEGEVAAVCAVGGDEMGSMIVGYLESNGVKAMVERVRGESTAMNAILVVRGEDRRFHVYPGANTRLSSRHVVKSMESFKPGIVYVSLGFSKGLDEGFGEVLEAARSLGATIIVDPAYSRKESVEAVGRIIGSVDAAHLNLDELRLLTGVSDPVEGVKRLAGAGLPRLLAVTSSSGAIAVYESRLLVEQRGFSVDVMDPTGAGDAFMAGLILSISSRGLEALSNNELAEALMRAQAAGALAVSMVGATTALERDAFLRLVESQGKEVIASTVFRELGGL